MTVADPRSKYPFTKITDIELRQKINAGLLAEAKSSLSTPLYAKVLSGIGAWLAAWFILSSVLSVVVFQSTMLAMVVGLIVTFASAFTHRHFANPFFQQVSLAVLFCGNGLLLFATVQWWPANDWETAVVAQFMISVCCYVLFNSDFVRFILPLSVVVITLAWQTIEEITRGGQFLFIILLILWFILWFRQPQPDWLRPLAFSLSVALLVIPLWLIALANPSSPQGLTGNHWLDGVMVTCVLLMAVGYVARQWQWTLRKGLWVGLLCAVFSLMAGKGLLASGLLLLMGYWRDELSLIWLGRLFGAVFLFWYYYSLEFDFIVKGAALLVSGALLLLLAWYLENLKDKHQSPRSRR